MKTKVTFDWITIGELGNSADRTTGHGAVNYEYQISKHLITIGEYTIFLNASAKSDPYGLYNESMETDLNIAGIARHGTPGEYTYSVIGSANRPISYVSWFDAARFVNWIENGQGDGSTETGVYELNGATSGIYHASEDATHRIPTQDEWYKAAYYDPTLGNENDANNYHLYTTRSDIQPGNEIGNSQNQANYRTKDFSTTPGSNTYSPSQNYLTDVGSFTASASYFGTLDQGGNLTEWTDTIIDQYSRCQRGGSWLSDASDLMATNYRHSSPMGYGSDFGFRISRDA